MIVMRLILVSLLVAALALPGCAKKEPLTEAKAAELIRTHQFAKEPVYAEVPQRVWWSSRSPQDDYDVKALATLRNLERAGYVTVSSSKQPDGETHVATVTQKGFPLLGTVPTARGPGLRAMIAEKVYDGLQNFRRHPSDPTIAHADLMWHYTNPTPLYELFETKINKPLNKPFASYVSFYYKDYQWRFGITVRKAEAG